MSNAPKTGFFQTIPGLITATAGFLSAATGAIVALNSTGVVDLKKMVGSKPPEQSSPLVSPAASTSTDDKRPGLELSAGGGGAVEPRKQDDPSPAASNAPSTSTVPREPVRPVETATQHVPETKSFEVPQAPAPAPSKPAETSPLLVAESKQQNPSQPSSPASTADAEKLSAIREGAATASKKQEEPLPATTAPTTQKRETPPPVPVQERVVESTPQPVKPVSSAPAREAEKPMPSANPKAVETAPQVVKAPPSPSAPDKMAPPKPDPKERVADARNPDRGEDRPTPDDDARRARIVRPPSDAVATRGSGKRLATDDEPGVRKVLDGTREAHSAGAGGNRQLDLAGLKMTIPAGWVKEEVKPGPMAAVAALRISDPGGDGTVQITRYLGAKGKEMEDRTIERWVGQVTKANGAPMTLADAKIERRQVGPVRITTVDLSGTVKMSPRDTGEAGSRMISAIVDHPAGPHLVTIVGPARSMAKWDSAIDGFLKSAKPE